ncbi:sensor histidine kinase [Pseudorhodoferax sp. Leaf274]|uniref:sensor histidine kinase n=1 Tax=Pseudorhodoferax sp. Leaf274 TaxID=1736318 RepID=UPI000703BBE6|nr:sensor histidine kinase [Pseudorhodoferax sp. Leaf274]KQP39896.1 hypothetical protein ASF44_09290 [Pseudorhodoferax sp. Leaf274]
MLAVVALASLLAGQLAATDAERSARDSTERLMAQFASQLQHGLNTGLRTRLAVVQVTAEQIAVSGDRAPRALQRHLAAVSAQFSEFAWLGVLGTGGGLVAETGSPPGGAEAAQHAWPVAARTAPWLGDARDVAPGVRVVDAMAPLPGGEVLATQLRWEWIEQLCGSLLTALGQQRQIELLLIGRDGTVLTGPAAWRGRSAATADLTEGGRFVVGRHDPAPVESGPGWSVAVRQPAAIALAGVERLRRTVLLTVLAAGLLAAVSAPLLTRWLTRRLGTLAEQAQDMRQGLRTDIEAPPGEDEVSRIGATLAALVAQLQGEKAALARLNAELDRRVAERTARIEAMSEEARHAAVTRERLRLARDLHDTLAHSLMALLQQIRLVRKLRDRMAPQELADELGRAEEVAAAGLTEARAAITQMRHGTVRENGLSSALRELLARFGERTGVATRLSAEGPAADLADERAETLYRIVEEALRNVERHAQARTVAVTLDGTQGTTVLCVRDDGVGFDPQAPHPGHYGMVGIQEQAALVGAALAVDSSPGAGTSLRLEFTP